MLFIVPVSEDVPIKPKSKILSAVKKDWQSAKVADVADKIDKDSDRLVIEEEHNLVQQFIQQQHAKEH